MWIFLALILTFYMLFDPTTISARVTPEDIINSKKEAYQQVVKTYSLKNQDSLSGLMVQITDINKQRTDMLSQIMSRQGQILDEFQARNGNASIEAIEKARYWITFAHEAVAFQAAKIYIFTLSGEKNISTDAKNTINLLKNELNSTRTKVIYSQNILRQVIKNK